MLPHKPTNMLVLASFFKGERFMQQAHARGVRVYLLTRAKLLREPWPREALGDVFAQEDDAPLGATVRTVAYLNRTLRFDSIVALDDFDVEVAAALREHLQIPGMGESQSRFFRDKLACRMRLHEKGIRIPEYSPVFNNEDVAGFTARVPAPWMLKPRTEASATGIVKVRSADELWPLLEALGDRRSHHLLEQYVPGDVYHADAITAGGRVIFSEVARCGDTPFDVAHGGGMFTTATLERNGHEEQELQQFNREVLAALDYHHGASHLEFIKGRADGRLYLLETSARVGGARIAEMHEASTGRNLWAEWANVEADLGTITHRPLEQRHDYAGLIMTLARQERVDYSGYTDPEIAFRAPEANHAGLIVRSPDRGRVLALLEQYKLRFRHEFMAVLPAPPRSTH